MDKQVMLTETFDFEGRPLPFYVFKGRACIIASDAGAALGYGDDGKKLVDRIRDDWAAELIKTKDYDVLLDEELREFRRLSALTPESGVSARTRNLTVLYESGLDRDPWDPLGHDPNWPIEVHPECY
jgi:hypothetical protein